jgi:hypothetical protein
MFAFLSWCYLIGEAKTHVRYTLALSRLRRAIL